MVSAGYFACWAAIPRSDLSVASAYVTRLLGQHGGPVDIPHGERSESDRLMTVGRGSYTVAQLQ